MKPTPFLILLLIFFSFSLQAQTLFTYANKEVPVKEYQKAFDKAHTNPVTNESKEIRDYLELYINSKLKIEEATQRGYDTLQTFLEEYASLRSQVINNFLTDPETMKILVLEAFERGQKDISVQHIFIPISPANNYADSAVAKLKAQEAFMELSSGKKFEDVAIKFSADPAVAANKGSLGYVTVFSLPYEFENVVYKLPVGKYSSPYKSGFGYHIFRNAAERKAVGRIKASQILLAIPPKSDSTVKKRLSLLADSIYNRIVKGDDFANLAEAFSNDVVSAASGGQMPEFGTGTYDPAFENVVFKLPANGVVSKPFYTEHGYHIVKRTGLTPFPAVKNIKGLDEVAAMVEKDPRAELTRDAIYKKIIEKGLFKKADIDDQVLYAYIDSIVAQKKPAEGNTINNDTELFRIGSSKTLARDFVTYVQSNTWKPDGSGKKTYPQMQAEHQKNATLDYYKDHLEEFNEEFRMQMKELKEGNLFFEIMMREVWSKAQADTAGQMNYYNKHKSKYMWTHSADAVIFYCSDTTTAQSLRIAIIKNPSEWSHILENYTDNVTADSARTELSKISAKNISLLKPGTVTDIQKNKDDNSASFAYILKTYPQAAQKTFEQARGDVISDYQDEIDRAWIAELKKKYKVTVNEEVLKTIAK